VNHKKGSYGFLLKINKKNQKLMDDLLLKQTYDKTVVQKYKGRIVQPFNEWKTNYLNTLSKSNSNNINLDQLQDSSVLTPTTNTILKPGPTIPHNNEINTHLINIGDKRLENIKKIIIEEREKTLNVSAPRSSSSSSKKSIKELQKDIPSKTQSSLSLYSDQIGKIQKNEILLKMTPPTEGFGHAFNKPHEYKSTFKNHDTTNINTIKPDNLPKRQKNDKLNTGSPDIISTKYPFPKESDHFKVTEGSISIVNPSSITTKHKSLHDTLPSNNLNKNKNNINIKELDNMFDDLIINNTKSLNKMDNASITDLHTIQTKISDHMKSFKQPHLTTIKVIGYRGSNTTNEFHVNPYESNWKVRFVDNISHGTESEFANTIRKNKDLSKESEFLTKNYPNFKIGYSLHSPETGRDFLTSNPPYNELWTLQRVLVPKKHPIGKKFTIDMLPTDLSELMNIHNENIKQYHINHEQFAQPTLISMKYHPSKEYWKEYLKCSIGLDANNMRKNLSSLKDPNEFNKHVIMENHPHIASNLVNMAKVFDVHEPEKIHLKIGEALRTTNNTKQLHSKIDEIFDHKNTLPEYAIAGLFSSIIRKAKNAFSVNSTSELTSETDALSRKLDNIEKMLNSKNAKLEGEINNSILKAEESLRKCKELMSKLNKTDKSHFESFIADASTRLESLKSKKKTNER
jgi:hypothetical protein